MRLPRLVRRAAIGALVLSAATAAFAQPAATLVVDATDAPRNLLHARETIPARPGPLTLFYPKWIPGEHGPTGPLTDLVNVRFFANGVPLAWRRDLVEMHAFQLEVPAGATEVVATFDFILPPTADGFSSGASSTSQLVVLSWNQVALYPLSVRPDDFKIAASVKVPAGWKFSSALKSVSPDPSFGQFPAVSFNQLVDSPVQIGAHVRRIVLSAGGPTVTLNLAADSEAALALTPEQEAGVKQLVVEARALFGAEHYGSYDFLYTLSDHVARFGLEHHQSSDDRMWERALIDEDLRRASIGLLPHEYVHSWNGKYRRPAGLATGDFHTPMKDDLLWVYEGLTEYLGNVLTVRAGLFSADEYRENLARLAAYLDLRPGRAWRPLQDTADEAQLLYATRGDYDALRRSVDFYDEGELLWLEADVTIRQLTHGDRSLDDFCRAFHGAPSTLQPVVKPYTFDDVVAALNTVAPFDWRKFLTDHLKSVENKKLDGGIEGGGWKVVFKDKPGPVMKSEEASRKYLDARFSLGVTITNDGKDDGTLNDVIPGTSAAQAGLAPGMKLVAVNGRRYSADGLREALKAATTDRAPLTFIVENRDYFTTHDIDYHGGEKYPALERNAAKPDMLAQIATPLAQRK
jgi:predicted metalloprotease with PDZ domain